MKLEVPGFKAAAVAADIRGKGDGRLDLGLVFAGDGASVAAVFTTNAVAAPPVAICRERVADGTARAILVNSGNANCMTLSQGREDALKLSGRIAGLLGVSEDDVLPCSTGVIGQRLPVGRMIDALEPLVDGLSPDGIGSFSMAILTTDTGPKRSSREISLDGGTVRVVGVAKGAGMIAPDMATMLCYILTDGAVDPGNLRDILVPAVDRSFNAITIDGDMSTNDTVILMASGKGPEVREASDLKLFAEAVSQVCEELADMIVADGEGATKVVTVRVSGAVHDDDARRAARSIAESLLVKTALAAADPNWGRIAAAAGYSGAVINPGRIALSIGDVTVLEDGEILGGYDESEAVKVMKRDRYGIGITIGDGPGTATIKTCDLTEEYVRINCEYRT
ncbi:MAG: bifunctional glutamate N-acetyltransferase/amino-acid acetyltransferase ArgJ [bacterium]|nr:bifunctional glutamate N-acetyltransferase/amino-acid acetyltransferase ArgJ [bacterium]